MGEAPQHLFVGGRGILGRRRQEGTVRTANGASVTDSRLSLRQAARSAAPSLRTAMASPSAIGMSVESRVSRAP